MVDVLQTVATQFRLIPSPLRSLNQAKKPLLRRLAPAG
jgi:hypothetical protein